MWKIYQHSIDPRVTIVLSDGTNKVVIANVSSSYFTVEDQLSKPPKMVVDENSNRAYAFFNFEEAKKKCALLNAGVHDNE